MTATSNGTSGASTNPILTKRTFISAAEMVRSLPIPDDTRRIVAGCVGDWLAAHSANPRFRRGTYDETALEGLAPVADPEPKPKAAKKTNRCKANNSSNVNGTTPKVTKKARRKTSSPKAEEVTA